MTLSARYARLPDPGHDADALWPSAIILDPETSQEMGLRAHLMAVGLEVAMGPDAPVCGEEPLILVPACRRQRADVVHALDRASKIFPDAPVFFVTGVTDAPSGDVTDGVTPTNPREILRAAGLRFISALELRDAA